MPLTSRSRRREDEREHEEPARRDEAPPADDLQRILALQRTAGNHAVARTLARKVKIEDQKPPTISHKAKLPAIPNSIVQNYGPVLQQIRTRAEAMASHKELQGTYDTALAFYQAIADEIQPPAANAGPSKKGRWELLQEAVETDGTITPVPWTRFSQAEATLLEAELLACPVQVAGNGKSTAAHANKHGKLPKPSLLPNGEFIDTLDAKDQMDKTDYFEMLISGGHKKNHGGIERAIIDIVAGRVWITAHYDTGSLAELTGFPGSIVPNWRQKIAVYKAGF